MATAASLVWPKCRMCSRHRHPAEFVGDPEVGYCWHCYEWHLAALLVLAGGIPRGCQACGKSYDELERLTANGDVRMCLHSKDGILQLLCGECSDRYEPKRLDLYGSTPYGHVKKLKGAK